MAQKLKFGGGTWATKKGSTLAYNDENNNYKPLPFTTTRDSIATRVNKQGLIEVVGNDIPRIDYTDTSDGVLLLEKAATNLITNSEKFVDAPTGATNMDLFSGTITSNSTTSPDGNVTAMKFTIGGTSSSLLRIYQSDLSTSSDNTFSIYAKKGTANSLSIDITDVTVVNSILTDEWQRISVTNISTSSKFIDVEVLGNVGEYIYIWGLQAEINSVASSYIPTQGSASTRLADTASGSGNSEVFNDSQGVVFFDVSAFSETNSFEAISINDNSTSDRIFMGYYSDDLYITVVNGGQAKYDVNTPINVKQNNKIAVKYKAQDFSFYLNGFEIDASVGINGGTTPSGLSKLSFNRGDGVEPFYGKTKELGYYNTVLTDAELEYLTSYRSLSELVTELNLNTL